MTGAVGRMRRTTSLPTAAPRLTLTTSFVVGVALLLAACGSTPSSRVPTTPSASTPALPAVRTHTLSGLVTVDGRPAVGARVTVLETQPEPSATTDDSGRYSISVLATSSIWGRTLVRFSKPGYFTDFQRSMISQDTRLDVALDPLTFIAVGDVARGTVKAGDAICAGPDYEPDPCQRFALIPPVAGSLEIILTSRDSPGLWALDVVNPDGRAVAEFLGSPKRLSISARAGGIYEIRVVGSRAGVDFELMTSLR
jgi:Carboxypeptidase regulatory-like domain